MRSGSEHCGSRVAVEQEDEEDNEDDEDNERTTRMTRRTRRTRRRGGGEEDERRTRQEEATDIKSNNPHLAGGEHRRCKLEKSL